MNVITKLDRVKQAAILYERQYHTSTRGWETKHFGTGTHEKCYNLLLVAKSEKDVDDAIGVKGWAENKCHECGKDCDLVVEVGETPDYESNTASLCLDCLLSAVRLAEKTRDGMKA